MLFRAWVAWRLANSDLGRAQKSLGTAALGAHVLQVGNPALVFDNVKAIRSVIMNSKFETYCRPA